MSSNAYLNALGAMELSQMCVQAVWDSDSPLKQVPGFSTEVIQRLQGADVNSIYDLMELEDTDRDKLLQMDNKQLRAVAHTANAYPSIELTYDIEDAEELSAGEPIVINVHLEREVDEDEEVNTTVPAPFFPGGKKNEQWWVVVGRKDTRELLSVKRVSVRLSLFSPSVCCFLSADS
jgi:pre-mRNA-splicing helicase BRR2